MRRIGGLFVVALALVVWSVASVGVAFAATTTQTVVNDPFDSLDLAVWNPRFFSNAAPSTGTATTTAGILSMRPANSRGGSKLESKAKLVTSLPAHVHVRLRLPSPGYRYVAVYLTALPASQNNDYTGPRVGFGLGTTDHNAGWYPDLGVTSDAGPVGDDTKVGLGPVPVDTWLDVDMWLNADSIDASYNGSSFHVAADIQDILDSAGGFYLGIGTNDDYWRSGLDLDNVTVEQRELAPAHVRGVVRDGVTGAPLPGVRVGAWREPESDTDAFATVASAETSADGSYDMTMTGGGWYAVSFDDPTGLHRDEGLFHSGLPLDWTPAIPVDVSQEISGLDARLMPKDYALAHRTDRLGGLDRYQTALEVSRTNFASSQTVVLTGGGGFADAVAASPLCGAYDAPLLLTSPSKLPNGLYAELARLKAKKVIVIGGTAAVPDPLLAPLRGRGLQVTRVGGRDRYETAAKVVRDLMDAGFELAPEPFVVRGDTFPDALAVAPFAYQQLRPVLLVTPTSAPPSTVAMMKALGADTVYVVGSDAAVGFASLKGLAAGTPEGKLQYARVTGRDRYETAENLVLAWDKPYDQLGIASGESFADALTGAVGMGKQWGALLLSRPGSLDGTAMDIIADNGEFLWPIQVYGGGSVLSDNVAFQARAAAGSSFLEYEDALLAARKPLARQLFTASAKAPKRGRASVGLKLPMATVGR